MMGLDDDETFGAMVDVCLKANAAVVESGTPAMIAMMRALLWQLGQEAAQRDARAEIEARWRFQADHTDKLHSVSGSV
jgi:hypothetical protein